MKADRTMGGLGLNEKEIGLYYGTYGAAAFVLGSLLAGYYIARRGLKTPCLLCAAFSTFLLLCMPCLLIYSRKVVGLYAQGLCLNILDTVLALSV